MLRGFPSLLFVLLIAISNAACDQQDNHSTQDDITDDFELLEEVKLQNKKWLQVYDQTLPEFWLAAINENNEAPNQKVVEHYALLLHRATKKFDEGPRMIANRTVQLKTMLSEININKNLDDILILLTKLREDSEHQVNYSALCSQYFNLVKSGVSNNEIEDKIRSLSNF